MSYSEIYGTNMDISVVRELLENGLSQQFTEHDSSFWGVYFSSENGDERIKIYENEDPIDGEAINDEFGDYRVLVEIFQSSRSDAIFEIFKKVGIKLLKGGN